MAIDDVTLDRYLRGKALIAFFKKDGTIREMVCTTNLSFIPADQHPKGESKYNPSIQKVYDLGLSEWRSFVKNNLMRVEEYKEK